MNHLSTNRTLINVIGIPAILYLLWRGGLGFALFIFLVMIIGLDEFYRMNTNERQSPVKLTGYIFTVLMSAYYFWLPAITLLQGLSFLACFIIITLFIEMGRDIPNPTRNMGITVLGIMYVPVLLGSVIALRNLDTIYSTYFTVSMVVAIWICDSVAYIFGMKWGQKKIFPRVSPNKSWVGSIAGLVSTFIVFYVLRGQGILPDLTILDVAVFSIITGFFGQVGDFAESLLKRDVGVKDSGKLLLGHGGVLDRFDSITFASPLTFAYITLIYYPRLF
ncbi:MAG: phosphatidate cytidylyltransferase [Candidatus Neomarinimicrobiota bacterium]|nr:MAG: phosphatidate cytidylyltransferase [Candidatus Neomarinimicrobiota bacterium]